MFENLSFTSLTNTISNAANRLWDSTKSFLTTEPEPLWQKAMYEPGYQAYLRFKSDLEHRSEEALRNIVSPYAVIANTQAYQQSHEDIQQLLESNPEAALTYFYNDIINHLVELSASQMSNGLLMTNANIDTLNQMLAFYQPYVPEDLYQDVLKQTQLIDTTNIQSSLVNVTKKINQAFKHLQLDLNSNPDAEQHFSQNPEPYHSVNYKHLILMGAVSLLANRNSLGMGLATTALLAEPVEAALPTVINPIPTQYVDPGQTFSYDIDLNQVFNDADGNIMSFGGITLANKSPLPSWVKAEPVKLWGRDYYGEAVDVEVVGNVAYVANGQYGLLILNVSDPMNTVFLTSLAFLPNGGTGILGNANGVTVQNQVAYVAQGTSGLQLIDVSNVNIPRLLGAYDIPGSGDSANDVVVQNDLAFVAYGTYGLKIVNVSNPNNPTLVGSYDTPGGSGALGITVQNGVAYVADDSSGLQIINVSNVTNPTLLGNYNTPQYAHAVVVQNGVAYVADDFSGLQIINVSNVTNPILLGNYDTQGYARDVIVQNGVAYVADWVSGLQLINVTNPRAPKLLSSYATPGYAYAVVVQNDVAYVANYNSGLQLINVTNASNPTRITCYDALFGDIRGVEVQNGVGYLANDVTNGGMQIWNVSNPRCPKLLGNYNPLGGYAHAIKVKNKLAYLVRAYNLDIINVTNPMNPIPLGTISFGSVNDYGRLDVQNGVAYVADYTSGLQVINVINPQALSLLANYPGNALDVSVQNSRAYLVPGLRILNVTNASLPTLLGSYTTSNGYGVVVQNDITYVADFTSLQIINVTNASNPTFLGSINTGGFPGFARGLAVQNGVAYVADAGPGLLIINVTNPSMPTLLGSYDTFGTAWDVTIQNEVAYVSDGTAGIQIIGLDHARLFGVAPTANGIYDFSVSATNANGEWISTNMELIVGTVSPATSASSPVSTSSGVPSATTSLPTQSGQPITTPSVSMSDTGTDTGTSSPLSTPSTSLPTQSGSLMTTPSSRSSSPTVGSTSTTASNPVPTTSTQPNPSTGNSGDVSSASRLTGSLLLTSALLLSTTGLGFLAKNRKAERSQEEAVEVVENTIVLRH